jgi:CheY-like chemotaxis protein
MKPGRPILIIEDSDEDYHITSLLLRNAGVTHPIVRLRTGKEVVTFVSSPLSQEIDVHSSPLLILLDLNLPGRDGRDLLLDIRRQYWLQTVPVVILTTSANPNDVRLCYRRGAHGYILKPVDLDGFEKTMQHVADYWLQAVELPEPQDGEVWPQSS